MFYNYFYITSIRPISYHGCFGFHKCYTISRCRSTLRIFKTLFYDYFPYLANNKYSLTNMILVWPLGSIVMSLLSVKEFRDSVTVSAAGFFPSGELFNGMCGLRVSEFQYRLSTFCLVFYLKENHALCLLQVRESPQIAYYIWSVEISKPQ